MEEYCSKCKSTQPHTVTIMRDDSYLECSICGNKKPYFGITFDNKERRKLATLLLYYVNVIRLSPIVIDIPVIDNLLSKTLGLDHRLTDDELKEYMKKAEDEL